MPTTPPLRVLMLADAVGGVWTYALDLISGLAPRGYEFCLALMGPAPSAAQRAVMDAQANLQWHHRPYALEWMEEPWAEVGAAIPWLLGLEAAFQPNRVHVNGYAHAALPWRAPVLLVAHSCVASWWRAVKAEPLPARYDRYRHAVCEGLAAADQVVVPTEALGAALVREHGAIPRLKTILNGRDWPELATERDLAEKEPFILTAGRLWDEAKNLALLAEIGGHVRWPIWAAGAGWTDSDKATGPAEPGAVQPLGALTPPQLERHLRRAAIYAAPARYEPFGLAILEAARSGCALVLADLPSLRELWDGAAVFVSTRDPAGWVAALNGLADDPAARNQVAAQCHKRATLYGRAPMVAAYAQVYEAIGQGEQARRRVGPAWREAA